MLKSIEYGIRLGGSLSSIDGGAFDDGRNWGDFTYTIGTTSVKGTKNPLFSLNPTLFVRYYLSEKAFFQPEIGIQFIGFNQKVDKDNTKSYSNSYSNLTVNIRTSYLQIPLLVGYKIGNSDYQPYILAGLTPAFLLSNKATSEYTETIQATGIQTKTASEASGNAEKKLDLGFTIGGGVMSFRSMPAFGAEIRYTTGMVNLGTTNTTGLYGYDYTAYNNALSIAVYYHFNL